MLVRHVFLMTMMFFSGWAYSATQSNAVKLIQQTRAPAHYPCAECHGVDGNPGMTAKYHKQSPKLAGQDQAYLLQQLRYFKNGQRFTAEMAGAVQAYSDQELVLIAGYFAQQRAANNPPYAPARDTLKRSIDTNNQWIEEGEKLYTNGDDERGIIACQSCHENKAQGRVSVIPSINGQYARYIRSALMAYKTGDRKTDEALGQPMQKISQRLSHDDINAVAAYLEQRLQ